MTRLPDPDWLHAKPTQHVLAALNAERPNCARLVGGCVRNGLLGQQVTDIDIATQLTPDVVARVLEGAGCAVHPTGIEHGTVTAVAMDHVFEITTLRRDVETDGRHATVAFTEDWTEDAERRDFTINALYADASGEVFDPTNEGLGDIAARKVVFVGDPETRIREDYLRILRFFRFYAWYADGAPDADGLAACKRLVDGLDQISAERIWTETKKLVAAPAPLSTVRAMSDSGVLAKIIPDAREPDQLARLAEIDAAEGHAPDPLLRVLSLAPLGEEALTDLARRMKVSNEERKRLLSRARNPQFLAPDVSVDAIYRHAYRLGADALTDRLTLLRAEQPEHDAVWKAHLASLKSWRRPELPVGGADIIAAGVEEGPRIGPILRAVEAGWVDSNFSLSRETLLENIRQLAMS